MNANKLQHNVGPIVKHKTKSSRSIFRLNVKTKLYYVQEIHKVVQLHVDWGGISITPLLNFPREIFKKIVHCLFLGSPHIGDRLSSTSIVDR